MIGMRAQLHAGNVVQALEQAPAAIAELTQQAVSRVSEALQGKLMEAAPVGKTVPGGRAPGTLRRSIRFAQDGTIAQFFAAGHVEFVIAGTRPHTIEAGSGGSLSFFWERVGTWVMFQSVHHPGTQANDFRVPAVAATEPALEAELVQIGDQLFERLL